MVLFTVTKTDGVRVSDIFQRTVTLHKAFTDIVRIAETRFFSPITIILATEIIRLADRVSFIKSLLRYLGLNMGRGGIRIRQAKDEAVTEV